MAHVQSRMLRAVLAAGAAIGLLAIGVSAPAQAATIRTITFDCFDLQSEYAEVTAIPGDTVVYSMENCDGVFPLDTAGNIDGSMVPLDPAGDSFSVTLPSDVSNYSFGNTGTSDEVRIFIVEAESISGYPLPGVLQFTDNAVIPADASEMSLGGENGDESNWHYLAGIDTCGLDIESKYEHVYGTIDFTVTASGEYGFLATGSDPIGDDFVSNGDLFGGSYHPLSDPMMALYQDFDPANPDEGVIGCNDDLSTVEAESTAVYLEDGTIIYQYRPYFRANLEPGHYTLVVMTWEAINSEEWAAGESAFGDSFEPGAASVAFQLWGPEGTLEQGHVPLPQATLASTGIDATPYVSAALLAIVGVLLVMRRRRSV